MSDAEVKKLYGSATLSPVEEVVAGSYGTWTLTYTAGEKGVAKGGTIRIYTDADSDRAIPQMDDPTGADYLTVDAPRDARVGVLVQSVMSLVLTVNGRALASGEQVSVTYGDTRGGGPGFRAQTFAEAQHFFLVEVNTGDGETATLPNPPFLSIVGGEAAALTVQMPSIVVSGEPFRIQVKVEDAWGNPAGAYRGNVTLAGRDVRVPEENATFDRADRGVRWIDGCVVDAPGIHRIHATDGVLTAQSNPMACRDNAPKWMIYWGDSHGGQVAMAEKIPDFFRYARDVAGIHFVGYQRNDHVLTARDWMLQQEAERAYHQPGRFVALPGFEWSAQTARGGHHNVYFRRHDQPIRRSGHEGLSDKSDADTDLPHITDVYDAYRGTDTVITAHVGGEHSDLQYHDPHLEPAVEITSDHGTFEWILQETFERNYRMGFFGGSDSHNGRPGGDTPGFQHRRYAKAGLAAVYASELTIESVLDAYKARRVYATTGARILLHTSCEGHAMGEEFTTRKTPRVSAFVAGTAPCESVELYRGLERVYSHPMNGKKDRHRVRILWEGASRKSSYSGVIWEGKLKVSGRAIEGVEQIRFDSPRSRVFDQTDEDLRWYSVTCGYRSGIVLHLPGDGDVDIELAVNTSVITGPLFGDQGIAPPRRMAYSPAEKIGFHIGSRDLENGAVTMTLGPLNRRVTVDFAPQARAAGEVSFDFVDENPQPGINPYYVRVVQTDMEMAWSSPIFVDYVVD